MRPMRLWSLHPQYLDQKGLVALWREALLAQAVLRRIAKGERNVGYANHPQLSRFLAQRVPMASLARYMRAVHEESLKRGYRFQASRIDGAGDCPGSRSQRASCVSSDSICLPNSNDGNRVAATCSLPIRFRYRIRFSRRCQARSPNGRGPETRIGMHLTTAIHGSPSIVG